MVGRIPLGEEAQHALAILDRGMRPGRDDHAVRDFGRARGNQLGLALDRHEADPAIAHDRQGGIPAEGGNLDAGLAGYIENRLTVFRHQRAAVNLYRRHAQ